MYRSMLAQKRKRGDATGARALVHSAKRVAVLFPERNPQPAGYASKRSGTDRPVAVPMTEFQLAHLDEWVWRLQSVLHML